ncbi:MAG: hypothetical protein ACRD96_07885 [Bryobacteraceae bacterium]
MTRLLLVAAALASAADHLPDYPPLHLAGALADGRRLIVRQIDRNGAEVDRFQIEK